MSFRTRTTAYVLAVTAACSPTPQGGSGDERSGVDIDRAAAALEEFDRRCAEFGDIWSASLCGPMALVEPESRLAVTNRPDPGGVFERRGHAYVGSWPPELDIANTALDWAGERWAVVMLPLPEDDFTRTRLLAHEQFHRIQPELGHRPDDAMAAHLDEEGARLWLRMELRAWARALEATGEEARAGAGDAFLFRSARHAAYPDAAVVERAMEGHEGLAEYTGVRFALDATGTEPMRAVDLIEGFEDRPTYVRALGYGTGPALGLLLDRYDDGWRRELGSDLDLAMRLRRALDEAAVTATGEAGDEARARAAPYGFADVRAEERERAARFATLRAEYRARLVDGPVLIVDLPERRLMFNPNTVVSMGSAGSVYPGAILIGPWGRLTLEDGAALAPEDRRSARVRAPEDPRPDPQGRILGPGWSLELEPGWSLVPAERPGDLRLAPAGNR
jgi:hypothetical protein